MTEFETQRQAVPRVDTGEIDTALAVLDFSRECVLKKTEGSTTNSSVDGSCPPACSDSCGT